MRTVREVSRLAGVSIRTLHHYDAIGLLKPTRVTEAGYRLYDDTALRRLQTILLFRELKFPLKEIRTILDSPAYDPAAAIAQQITLLELERDRLNALLDFARELQHKGVEPMRFDVFDRSQAEAYRAEAREKWGRTAAFQEFEAREKAGEPAPRESEDRLMKCFAQLGALRHRPPGDREVQEKVAALQDFITQNYYTCTGEILAGLGEMYVSDDRFRQSIDSAGGEGTAAFVRDAIAVYCKA